MASTLRKGIEYSRNLMMEVAKNLGMNKILDLSKELEIYRNSSTISVFRFR